MAASFLLVLQCSDLLYINESAQCPHMLDYAYHKTLINHCALYSRVGWPCLLIESTVYFFIYKVSLGNLH